MRPTPHHVCEGVFIGSRVVVMDARTVRGFNITHIIVERGEDPGTGTGGPDPDAGPGPQDTTAWNAKQRGLPGVEYLECSVRDDDSQAMEACWRDAVVFIRQARQAGGNVLIHLHGRSRSASVAIAWLVTGGSGMGVRDAARALRKVCPHIDWGLVYPEQLMQFQQHAHHSMLSAGEGGE
jgi:hypothetical protein